MQDAFHDIQVDAIPVFELDQIKDDYDMILLALQIAYMYPQLKKKYGKKVMQIEAMDFATGNVYHIIEIYFCLRV